jgi:hypothetical protein
VYAYRVDHFSHLGGLISGLLLGLLLIPTAEQIIALRKLVTLTVKVMSFLVYTAVLSFLIYYFQTR